MKGTKQYRTRNRKQETSSCRSSSIISAPSAVPSSIDEIKQLAIRLGFNYRATGVDWMTLTYPDTNTHIVHIDMHDDVIKQLGDALVQCGRIQSRQQLSRIINEFNYD